MEHSNLFDFDILESDEWLDGPDLTDSLQAAASDQYEYRVERTKPNPLRTSLCCACICACTCQDIETVLSTRVTAVNIVGFIATIENLV